MTSDLTSTTPFAADCATFEERLMAYRERELDATTAAWMVRHQQACRVCETLMRDLDALVEQAAVLPTMSPSRDLWPDVLSRLDAPVVPLSTRFTPAASLTTATGSRRGVSIRMFAVAATMLVAVSSAVTWQVARSRGAAAADSTASANLLAARADVRPDTRSLQPVANADVDVVYEREIAALRVIVNERFAELDSATVAVLRSNLAIIDKAIADSRAALEKDPGSRALSSSLDRALENKLALMRRVSLL